MQDAIAEKPIFNKINKIIPNRPSSNRRIDTKNSSIIAIFLIITAVVIFCSLFYVWSQIKVVNIGYEISQANREKKELLQFNKKLKLEMATLASPYHIEGIAKKELRLMSPKTNQLVRIK